MFANLLAAPFVLIAMVFLYLAWQIDEAYAPWIIPFLLITALIFILKPELNWWWYRRHPPRLQVGLLRLLERFCLPYQRLDPARQQSFRERVGLFILATDWTPVAFPEDELPQDIQVALAAQAVALTLHQEDFVFEAFEKVIVYPGPFPTQLYPIAHASELYKPDGCLIFSAEQVIMAFTQPDRWFNVGLYEYARAFVDMHPVETWPDWSDDEHWIVLEQISGMSRAHVESIIGLPDADMLGVAIHHYFQFRARFLEILPLEAVVLGQIFQEGSTVEPHLKLM